MKRLLLDAVVAVAVVTLSAVGVILGAATQPATAIAEPVTAQASGEFYVCPVCARVLGENELDPHLQSRHPIWWYWTGTGK